nr:MAG TPA: hypothetical protein [Caudoviricetes sp.]
MNIKVDDFTVRDTVCSFENLYEAMLKCRRNVMWKDSVAGFVKNGLVNVNALRQSLLDGTYEISKYSTFKVYEPKERDIVSTRFKDRVFQRSLCDNYLYSNVTKSFIYDNAACQIGKGTLYARNRLETHLHRFYRKYGLNGWVLKCDLKNYFGSTSHKVAKDAINSKVYDDWAIGEVNRIIDSFNQGEDPNVGMGLGSQVTQLIQLAVLDPIDHRIKERLHIKHYVRYMDDFILIHHDKEYLQECKERIEEWLSELGLNLSVKKTQLFPLSQPISFLGFSFRVTPTGKVIKRIHPERISHERRKLRKLVQKAKHGVMTKDQVDCCYQSWKAHASYGDTHNLILKMDKYYKELWR